MILRSDLDGHQRKTSGYVTLLANLDRLYDNWRIPGKQHDWKLGGKVEGQVSLVHEPDNTDARFSLNFTGMELVRSAALSNGAAHGTGGAEQPMAASVE